LDRSIKDASAELKEIKAELIAAGAGEHEGTDGARALVVLPAAKISPADTAIAHLHEKLEPKVFAKLFTKIVEFKPVKDFRAIAGALLSAKEAAKVVELCETESAAQVRFS
jgi:hypothetical protein